MPTIPNLVPELFAADVCGPVTVTQSPLAGTPAVFGTNVVTLTVRDAFSNAANCTVTVVISPLLVPLKVNVQGNGMITTNPPQALYTNCQTVTLTATPTNCYWAFSHWTNGVMTNTANPLVITVGPTNCYTAVFTNLVPSCSNDVIIVTVNGRTNEGFYVTNRAEVCITTTLANAVLRYSDDCTEPTTNSTPYNGCFFEFYEGTFPTLHTSVVRVAAFTLDGQLLAQQACPITIVFTNECEGFYRLFASVKNSGGGLLAGGAVGVFPVHDPYPCGAVLHLNAQPAVGWEFMGWLGDADGTNLTADVTMSEPRCVDAVFGTRLTTGVTGNGAVRRIPDAGQYPYGTAVRLVAEPAAGQFFVGWSGNASGTNAILNFNVIAANPSVTATFAALPVDRYALSMRLSGRGTVTTRPYRNFYSPGVLITNTAVTDSGQMFLGWSGDTSGMVVVSTTSMYVPMSANRAITASFTRGPRLEIASCQGALSKEGFELMVTGDPGVPYEIQATAVLACPPAPPIVWTSLGTVSNAIGMATFLDRTATNHTQRFYRAVAP